MSGTAFRLLGWSAWAPGLTQADDWIQWLPQGLPVNPPVKLAKPPCTGAKAMLRRRFSMPTRLAMETAGDVCQRAGILPAHTSLVYGSANGEISSLKILLEDLSQSQPLSPTAFSNCVHHVPTGHFAITAGHKSISRTLSAFDDTFAVLFMEAICLLRRPDPKPVLLVLADETPPAPFDEMLRVPPFPYGVSLLLDVPASDEAALTFEPGDGGDTRSGIHNDPAFDFLRWYISSEAQLSLPTSFGGVVWKR